MLDEGSTGKAAPGELEDLPPEEQERVKQMLIRLMELGIGAVYGDEGDSDESARVDCKDRLEHCRSVCCTFQFALTKKEVRAKKLIHNPERPFFIKRDKDGYCPHLERTTLRCSVWPDRPARCRKFDCRTDPEVWLDAGARLINPAVIEGIGKGKDTP
jgi:Fe-S-cluster containining protein